MVILQSHRTQNDSKMLSQCIMRGGREGREGGREGREGGRGGREGDGKGEGKISKQVKERMSSGIYTDHGRILLMHSLCHHLLQSSRIPDRETHREI